MLSAKLKEAAGNGTTSTLYVDDVFSTWLYTGNGSTQTITNGIDLAGQGGLVWTKPRDLVSSHRLFDTARGVNKEIYTDSSTTQTTVTNSITAFNSNGFTMGSSWPNISPYNFASWTFRKAAKFFDVVTYTGTGANRTIAHNLGIAPGMVIVKRTDTTGDWRVYSNGMTSAAYSMYLNLTNPQASAPTVWNSTAPTSSVFSVGTDATVNASGGTYVAYLYAHDTSSTGIIQCGAFTKTSGVDVSVELGWEPQYIFVKAINVAGNNWEVYDSMRGFCAGNTGVSAFLNPNLSAAESSNSYLFGPTATGFSGYGNLTAATYIYMAIRRPNKPPTTGTQVFSPTITMNSTAPKFISNFPVDLSIFDYRPGGSSAYPRFASRLLGSSFLSSSLSDAETTGVTQITFDYNTGFGSATGFSANNVAWMFQRAPGFFDVVCYTSTYATPASVTHGLGAVPELIIVKSRSAAGLWVVYSAYTGQSQYMFLDSTMASQSAAGLWGSSPFTSSVFYINEQNTGYTGGTTLVAYLFATLAGISKVGSYTGNGTTQTINCGFTGGARFVLIKRTDSTGDWYVFDTARGMTTLTDPYLLLNSTAAEVATLGAVTSVTTGFAVNAAIVAAINTNAASYIFLAIA